MAPDAKIPPLPVSLREMQPGEIEDDRKDREIKIFPRK